MPFASNPLALIGGVPPSCDRCDNEDAKLAILLPVHGIRHLCNDCVVELVSTGLDKSSVVVSSNQQNPLHDAVHVINETIDQWLRAIQEGIAHSATKSGLRLREMLLKGDLENIKRAMQTVSESLPETK